MWYPIFASLLSSFYLLSLFYLIHIYCFKCHYRLMAHKAISLIAYKISQLECVTSIIKSPLHYSVCMHACSVNPVQLFATPWTVAHQAPPFMGFYRQENEWAAISSSRGSSCPKGQPHISYSGRWILYPWATWEAPGISNSGCKRLIHHCPIHYVTVFLLPAINLHSVLNSHKLSWLIMWYGRHNIQLGDRLLEFELYGCVNNLYAAAAAKSLQSCPTPCDPIDSGPPGSPVPGILQARTLECIAISFSSAWKGKVKVKSLSRVWLLATPWTAAYQAPLSMGFSHGFSHDFPGKNTGVGCHCICITLGKSVHNSGSQLFHV